jgi:hypothetical protein
LCTKKLLILAAHYTKNVPKLIVLNQSIAHLLDIKIPSSYKR